VKTRKDNEKGKTARRKKEFAEFPGVKKKTIRGRSAGVTKRGEKVEPNSMTQGGKTIRTGNDRGGQSKENVREKLPYLSGRDVRP